MNRLRNILAKKETRCKGEWEINIEELKRKAREGAIILDVRSVQEYNEGHLYGAIHLADYEIPIKHGNVLPNKNVEIVVYCQNGGRSKKACKKLKKLGYKNIYNLCGGLENIN